MAYQGPAIVAFIDLLGFSARLRSSWGLEKSALETLFAIKDRVRRKANDSPAFRIEGRQDTVTRTEIGLFSDSILLVTATPSMANAHQVQAATYSMASLVGDVILHVAELGFGVRGGIELGEIWWDGHEAIGPAFIDAYLIETRIKTARVVLGCGLLRYWAELAIPPNLWEFIYRCSDNLIAIRPILGAPALSMVRDAAPPEHAGRYAEILANLTPSNRNWRRNWLRSSANSVERLMRGPPPAASAGA